MGRCLESEAGLPREPTDHEDADCEHRNGGDETEPEVFQETQGVMIPRTLRHDDVGHRAEQGEVPGHRGGEGKENPAELLGSQLVKVHECFGGGVLHVLKKQYAKKFLPKQ